MAVIPIKQLKTDNRIGRCCMSCACGLVAGRWPDGMPDLRDTEAWALLTHAYGSASDIPGLLEQVRYAPDSGWADPLDELANALLHQGDIYTATYAAMPYAMAIVTDLAPSKRTDELLTVIGRAAFGGGGPDCPDDLQEDWDEAQDEAGDMILERLVEGTVTDLYAARFLASALNLSGLWRWGLLVENFHFGYALETRCATCDSNRRVQWYEETPEGRPPGVFLSDETPDEPDAC
jgi:hypothetical protein